MRMRNWKCVLVIATVSLCAVAGNTVEAKEPTKSGGRVILDGNTLWRVRAVRETEEIKLSSGEIGHYKLTPLEAKAFARLPKGTHTLAPAAFKIETINMNRIPMETSADWNKPGFDDGDWVRTPCSVMHHEYPVEWKLLLLRAQFEVKKPSDLKLSIAYKGGVVVYLNGEELTRKDMTKGEKGLYANAEPDVKEAFLYPDGSLITSRNIWRKYMKNKKTEALRIRKLSGFTIPAGKLKKGVNVLAISVHRSPALWELYATRYRGSSNNWSYWGLWSRAAVHDIQLTGPGATPNVSAPNVVGLTAWNHPVVRKVFVSDYGDPNEQLQSVRIVGVRNGAFAGQVVIGGSSIKGLKAVASDLSGPGKIPASAITIRYGLPDGYRSHRAPMSKAPFDTLDVNPPAEVVVAKGCHGAVQPLWITVNIPKAARAGEYKGRITVSAQGHKPIDVPLSLKVVGWTLPNYRKFAVYTDMFQSPDTLAMAYDVPMWSDKHWKLIEKSFELMGPMANKSVYITCVRRTHLGNEHAMVRWVYGEDAKLSPDFSIAEKYLDLAVKHLGKVPSVILYAWEPPDSMGHGQTFSPSQRKIHDRDVLITVVNPRTGKLKKRTGPTWGSIEGVEFWKKLISGMQAIVDKRGMSDSLLFGLMGDHRPTKTAMADIRKAAPKLQWAMHSHHYCDHWHGTDLGLCASVWGIKVSVVDPDKGRGYGWKNKWRLLKYPRTAMNPKSSLANFRTVEEKWIGGMLCNANAWPKANGARGIARQGADFWHVLKDRRGKLQARLCGRYPETYWGQLNIGMGNPSLFGQSKNGAVPTVRSEMIRENVQEIEARSFIEKALLDKAKKARLGADLARRCQKALDERIRLCMHTAAGMYASGDSVLWFISSGVTDRMDKLFTLASEVSEKLGK